MKKIFLLSLIFSVFCFILNAKTVDSITAQKVAENYYLLQSQAFTNTADMTLVFTQRTHDEGVLYLTGTTSEPVFYIYNVNQNQGFVIVSADDAATPVLGYSTSSAYTGKNMPPAFIKLLEKYKQEIIFIKRNALTADSKIQRDWSQLFTGKIPSTRGTAAVSPLLTTSWDQMPYYNDLCPYDYTYSSRTVTGCTATAMAQIMKFWNYPATGNGFHSYGHNTYGTLSANFGNTTYSWTSMPNKLTSANSAVATLMYHCGVAVEMNYGVASQGGSGAYVISSASPITACAEYAFKTYFGYDPALLQGLERANYSDVTWIQKLKTELDNGRPLQYAGFGQGGHTFVFDGYDNSNKFHVNWGWSGMYDGYFDINSLNPGSGGTGGGAGTYNNGQQALIGIKPISGGSGTSTLVVYSDFTVTPDPINYAQSFTVNVDILNNGTTTFTDSFATAIFNSTGVFIAFVEKKPSGNLPAGYHYTNGMTFSNSGLKTATPGTYIIAVYYKSGTSWKIIPPGSYSNYVVIEIKGPANTMELYDSMVCTPKIIVRKQSFVVNTKVANAGSSTFYGDITLDIHDLDGIWLGTIDSFINGSLTNGFYRAYSFQSNGINVSPGTYLLIVWSKSNSSGTWKIVGSTYYTNPITVRVIEPSLNPDIYERNNTEDSSYVLPITFISNSAQIKTTGTNIHVGNDYDFFKVNLPVGYTYTITARVHDQYNSGDGNIYTTDVLFAYKKGAVWSDSWDDIMPGPINLINGTPLEIYVAPIVQGNVGTYLLEINITRSISPYITVTSPTTGTDWTKGTNQTISWTDNIPDNVIVDLYKGASKLLTLSSSAPSTGTYPWTIPMSLTAASDYMIKITSTVDNLVYGVSTQFTISDGQSITVTSPTTGNDWKKGTNQTITWTDNISDNVMIDLYQGASKLLTLSSSSPSNGTYPWTVPVTVTAASDYKIKITSTADNNIYGYSNLFTISDGLSITVTSPTTGNDWKKGTNQTITWSDNIPDNVIIDLYKGTSQLLTLSSSTSSTGTYPWIVPLTLTAASDYKIKITSTVDNNVYDYSNLFTISDGLSITVTSPTTGTDWKKGTNQTISWSDNISDNVIIELFKGTSQLLTINTSAPSTGTYAWTLPMTITPANDYKIKITSTADNNLNAYSYYFTISEAIGINDQVVSSVNLFPNPAKDYTLLVFGNKSDFKASITLYNNLGQIVKSYNDITISEGKYHLNLSELNNGVYYIQLINESMNLTKKLNISR